MIEFNVMSRVDFDWFHFYCSLAKQKYLTSIKWFKDLYHFSCYLMATSFFFTKCYVNKIIIVKITDGNNRDFNNSV